MNWAGAIDAALLCHADLRERLNLPAPNPSLGGMAENMIWAGEQHRDVRNPSESGKSALWDEWSGRGEPGAVRPTLCRVLEVGFGFCRQPVTRP
jgi:hypothetical protein